MAKIWIWPTFSHAGPQLAQITSRYRHGCTRVRTRALAWASRLSKEYDINSDLLSWLLDSTQNFTSVHVITVFLPQCIMLLASPGTPTQWTPKWIIKWYMVHGTHRLGTCWNMGWCWGENLSSFKLLWENLMGIRVFCSRSLQLWCTVVDVVNNKVKTAEVLFPVEQRR